MFIGIHRKFSKAGGSIDADLKHSLTFVSLAHGLEENPDNKAPEMCKDW